MKRTLTAAAVLLFAIPLAACSGRFGGGDDAGSLPKQPVQTYRTFTVEVRTSVAPTPGGPRQPSTNRAELTIIAHDSENNPGIAEKGGVPKGAHVNTPWVRQFQIAREYPKAVLLEVVVTVVSRYPDEDLTCTIKTETGDLLSKAVVSPEYDTTGSSVLKIGGDHGTVRCYVWIKPIGDGHA